MTEKEKEYYKDYRDRLKAAGVCLNCCQRKVAPGRVKCEICLAKDAERVARYKERLSPEKLKAIQEAGNEGHRRLYYLRKDQGLCVRCGKPAWGGKARCYECHLKLNRIQQNRRAKEWKDPGQCRRQGCRAPSLSGYRYCAEHIEAKRQQAAVARKHSGTENHPFRSDEQIRVGIIKATRKD